MFRASLCPLSGAEEYYTLVAACGISCCGFSSSWSGVELRVMRPVCRMLVNQHDTHSDLPLAPENKIESKELRKLLTIFYDKKKYVIHYTALKQCIKKV
jgi:hypothetical protein